jgi:nicotinamidase-related amidase
MSMVAFSPGVKSVLALLDMQHDFLAADGRMPVAASHVVPMLMSASSAIARFRAEGRPIVAIGNEFRRADWLMNILRRGASIEGSAGSNWDARVALDGLVYFPKWKTSAFSNPAFERWLDHNKITDIVLGGLYARACVAATASDALKGGFGVTLLESAIACASDRSKSRALRRLEGKGATVLRMSA